MTICYPQIITAQLCPREELTFSLTPPTCVRVVPVYNDATYVISQFPPPVHFLVRDNGQVYQLADIQSPPSTPPEYHAILDSTGCILVGVELSSVTTTPLTNVQINVLPGVLRHVLQTLNLPLTSVVNTLPPQRCRPQLWQQILLDTTDCLNSPPPPPPTPPSLTCSFVLSCLNPGQNINISTGGTISAGQLVPGPNSGEFTWVGPNGTPLFSFSVSSFNLNVQDTNTVDLSLAGNTLTANVIVSPNTGNQIQVLPNGLFVPPGAFTLNVQDTNTVDLDFTGNVLSANVLISSNTGNQIQVLPDGLFVSSTSGPCLTNPPNVVNFPTLDFLVGFDGNTNCLEQIFVQPEAVIYGNPNSNGRPSVGGLLYNPAPNNLLRAIAFNPSSITGISNTIVAADGVSINVTNSATNLIAVSGVNLGSAVNNVVMAASGLFVSNGVDTSLISIAFANGNFVSGSVISGQQLNFDSITRSAVFSVNSSLQYIAGSFVNTFFGNIQLAISSLVLCENPSASPMPNFFYSGYWGRDNSSLNGIPNVIYSLITADQSVLGNVPYRFSTIHSEVSFVSQDNPISHSFVSLFQSQLRGAINSVVIGNGWNSQAPIIRQSVVINDIADTLPGRVGVASPQIYNSMVISGARAQSATNTSIYVSTDINRIDTIEASIVLGLGLQFFDPNPPTNVANVSNSLIVGRNHDLSTIQNVNSVLLVGSELAAGSRTVFGVGFSAYTTPAIQAAGGWRAYIADGATPIGQNYFQGWENAWRFRPFSATDYPSTNAAVAALNAAYGGDPRNALATMSVAIVQGQPAIFAWNGATFVRITV